MDEQEALNQWRMDETKNALAEADCGDFASEEEVTHTMMKWTSRAD